MSLPSSFPLVPRAHRCIAAWLFVCCLMVLIMATIGAVTRLTESGLSIVAWKPVTGALPPLSETAWTAEFNAYRQSPEYVKRNHGMSLDEFKQIYFWEYLHRLWGRIIGVVFLIPFLGFLITRQLPRNLVLPLIGIFALGGVEAGVGWWMVKSGLVNDPRVSPYRLATHLGLAAIIYGALLLTGLRLIWSQPKQPGRHHLRCWSFVLIGLVFTTVLAGALVAGLDAGLIYNTFPLMNGSVVPPDVLTMKPLWRNLFENPATAQFVHRSLAVLSFTAILCFFLIARRRVLPQRAVMAWRSVIVLALVQVSLGIGTLLLTVPVLLASLHQMGAFLLLGSLVIGQEALRQGISQDWRPA